MKYITTILCFFSIKKLKLILFILLTCGFLFSSTVYASNESVHLVDWGSDEGIHRLERSQAKTDFFKLANQFESQRNRIFCGPTSTVIVLNALRVRKKEVELPVDKSSIPAEYLSYLTKGFNPFFQKYTQNNIFLKSPKPKAEVLGKTVVIHNKKVKDFGYQLSQLAELLKAYDLNVQMKKVTNKSEENSIKLEIVKNLKIKDNYVIVNYKRTSLGQVGGGHFSPLGAYDEESDSFLLMDVNPNLANWVWVKSTDLINAMREDRGYLLISEGEKMLKLIKASN